MIHTRTRYRWTDRQNGEPLPIVRYNRVQSGLRITEADILTESPANAPSGLQTPGNKYPFLTLGSEVKLNAKEWFILAGIGLVGSGMLGAIIVGVFTIVRWAKP